MSSNSVDKIRTSLTSEEFSVNEKKPTQSSLSKFDTSKKPRNQDEDKTDPKTSEGRQACS